MIDLIIFRRFKPIKLVERIEIDKKLKRIELYQDVLFLCRYSQRAAEIIFLRQSHTYKIICGIAATKIARINAF